MGQLVDGKWELDDFVDSKGDGAFNRAESVVRDWTRADGTTPHRPEAGRYHLYVSLACPWAHRTLILRRLKGLEEVIGLSIVDPLMGEKGWSFEKPPEVVPRGMTPPQYLHQLYQHHDPHYTGRATVPLLWDLKANRAVSNESAEIIVMLDQEFQDLAQDRTEYYPQDLRDEIDRINAWVYESVNNGVYRTGFAGTQAAYETAFKELFGALDELDNLLGERRYLAGDRVTLADWRLFTTLLRFDPVYYVHFKCNLKRIADYPNLWGYLKELYQWPGVKETCDLGQIKTHYYGSHRSLNPLGIVPLGPEYNLETPHGRG